MIIITGASKGIGEYLFNKFKEETNQIIGTFNKTTTKKHFCSSYFELDITDFSAIEKFINYNREQLNDIILINCAGITYNSFAHKAEATAWKQVIEVNLIGTFNMIRSILPIMRDQNFGRIINFSSVVTSLPTVGISAYLASKAGINGLTKALAIENASKGITINSIKLGYSDIGMGIKDIPYSHKETLINKIPTGRFCNPNEIFKTVKFIIDNEYVNGSLIDINGGLI